MTSKFLSISDRVTSSDILATAITCISRVGGPGDLPLTMISYGGLQLIMYCTLAEHEAIVTAWKAALDV